jgi:hypothetical protein
MVNANEPTPTIAAAPAVRVMLGSWDEFSAQVSAQSTALSRDAVTAGLRLLEQGASQAAEWMGALGQGSRRIGELAQLTERRLGGAADAAGVWNLELELIGETAQMALTSGQDAWLALARTQAELMQSALAQGEQTFERLVHAANGASPAAKASVATPVPVRAPDLPIVPFVPMAHWPMQWPALAETMTEGAQALFDAMAAAGASSLQSPAEATPVAASPPPRRARKPARKRKPA